MVIQAVENRGKASTNALNTLPLDKMNQHDRCVPPRGRKEFHMKSIYIKLAQIDDVYTLVNMLVAYDGDVDLESGRYKVDGKSLLGIFSLNLREPVKLTFHDESKADELFEKLKDIIVDAPNA